MSSRCHTYIPRCIGCCLGGWGGLCVWYWSIGLAAGDGDLPLRLEYLRVEIRN